MESCWNVINTEWDTDQETVNFGTRQCVVIDSALYDVVTLATVECSNPGTKSEPKISGRLWDHYAVLAIDSYCHILSDNFQTILKSFSLDSPLASISWSDDGKFLFLVTEGGFMSVVYIPLALLVITISLQGFSKPNHPVLVHLGKDEVLVLNNTGLLLRIHNFNLSALDLALSTNNGQQAQLVQSKMKQEVVDCILKTTVTSAAIVENERKNLVLAIGTLHGIFLWDFNRNVILTGAPLTSPLKEIQLTSCNKFLLALDEESRLVCYDCSFLLPIYVNESVGQYVLFEIEGAPIRTLTADLSDTTNHSLLMRSFMGLEHEYKVSVSDFSYLLSSATKQNDMVFLEGARDRDGNVTSLRIRKMAEGRPADRLRRLVARGRFDEGLRFAQNFGLDDQMVYVAKATKLAQELSIWSNTKPDVYATKYKDLILTLDSVKELRFVVECCLKFAPPEVDYIRSTLSYARKRLNSSKNKDEESDRVQYLMEVCNAQEKIDTFELIYGKSLIEHWYTIDLKDMFNTLIEILNNEDMTSALILWQRHNVEIVTDPSFAEEETLQLLGSIPARLKSIELLPWLQLVLPSLVQFDRERVPLVIEWIIRKAASLEISERDGWPQNALSFTNTLLNSLKVVDASPDGELCLLFDSISVLEEMVTLYEKYKIPITFSKFTQENQLSTVNMLLNWLPTASDVGPFLDDFLLPFMRRRRMDIDESLYNYILNLLHNSVSWWHTGEAQWEQIVATLIPYIKSFEVQAKSILAALGQAPVPWSATATRLAEKGKKIEHSLAENIKEEHQIVPLKTVLRHYNIHVFDLKDTLLMECIIRSILKQQTPDCLEHARIVARISNMMDENQVRTTYISSLLFSGKQELVRETLAQMPKQEQAECCQQLIFLIEGTLNAYVKKQTAAREKRSSVCMASLSIVWECYQTAAGTVRSDFVQRVLDLHNIHRLMSLGVALTSHDFCHSDRREHALRKFCVSLSASDEIDYIRLSRVTHLLRMNESLGLQELILVAESQKKDDIIVASSERLLLCPEDPITAEACFLAAQCLNKSSRAIDTIGLQSQLAAKAGTYCASECLLDASELCRLVNLRLLIHKRSSEVTTPDVYTSVTSLGVYQDFTTPILNRDILKYLSTAQGRVLPSATLTKETSAIVGLSAKVSLSDAAEALREFAKECLSVVQVLRGCRQLLPALYVTYASDSLVHLLFCGLPNLDLVSVYNKTISKQFDEISSQLLLRVMTSNRPEVPDMALATSCLLILGPKEGYKYLVDLVKRSTSDRRRVFYVGFLGRLLFKLSATGGEEEVFFDSVLLRCHWSIKLAPFGIHVQIPPSDEMAPIMDTLVTLEEVPLELLKSFCNTFSVNLNSALVTRSQFLISTTDSTNFKQRIPKILEVLSHLSPCEVHRTIANVRSKVSPYNYELLACLLGVLYDLSPDMLEVRTMLDLLEFLKCYERCVPPGPFEQQAPFYRLKGSEDWPSKRLPMYYQIDASLAKNIYYEEFQISNWTVWYNSPSLLPINRDEICMLAISNTIKRYNKDVYENSQIELLFQKIKECLDSISTVSLAAVCAGDLTQRLSTSPEHFYAADLHMQQCEKWKNEGDPAGLAAYNKSVKVYQRVQTEEHLRYYKLWDKRYELLTPYPERLVRSLFEDCRSKESFQAINNAAGSICEIFDIKFNVLKIGMMQEWLPPIEHNQQDEFYGFGDRNGSTEQSDIEAQNRTNLDRVICLLMGSDSGALLALLRKMALEEEERAAVRVRALMALEASLSEDQLMEHIGLHSYTLKLRIKVLNFLSRLEFLGLVYKEDEFEVADKADLIRALLQSGGSTQHCIALAMDIASYYVIQDFDIWSGILEKIIKLNMIETAERLLNDTSEIRLLWVNPVMAPIWNLILQAPFRQSHGNLNDCVRSLQRLWSCPILDDIDLECLEKLILASDFPYLGALLLPFLRQKQRTSMIKTLLAENTFSLLEKKLQDACATYPYMNRVIALIALEKDTFSGVN